MVLGLATILVLALVFRLPWRLAGSLQGYGKFATVAGIYLVLLASVGIAAQLTRWAKLLLSEVLGEPVTIEGGVRVWAVLPRDRRWLQTRGTRSMMLKRGPGVPVQALEKENRREGTDMGKGIVLPD